MLCALWAWDLLLSFLGDTKLGDVLGEDYGDLRPVLGKLAASTTVGALVENEELQKWLGTQAGNDYGLMQGFIGECKRIIKLESQQLQRQPSPTAPTPLGIFACLLHCYDVKHFSQPSHQPCVHCH